MLGRNPSADPDACSFEPAPLSLSPDPIGEVDAEMQRRVFPEEAWTDQLKKLLDVLRRMGLLGHVLRTTHVTGALCYFVSRTAVIEQPSAGASGLSRPNVSCGDCVDARVLSTIVC